MYNHRSNHISLLSGYPEPAVTSNYKKKSFAGHCVPALCPCQLLIVGECYRSFLDQWIHQWANWLTDRPTNGRIQPFLVSLPKTNKPSFLQRNLISAILSNCNLIALFTNQHEENLANYSYLLEHHLKHIIEHHSEERNLQSMYILCNIVTIWPFSVDCNLLGLEINKQNFDSYLLLPWISVLVDIRFGEPSDVNF